MRRGLALRWIVSLALAFASAAYAQEDAPAAEDGRVAHEVLATCLAEQDYVIATCVNHRFAVFEGNAIGAGPEVVAAIAERSGRTRAALISALGRIGYAEANDVVARYLTSSDWREAYAAARTLGWLGATEYVDELRTLAETHWLPDVREQAQASADALQSPERSLRASGANAHRIAWSSFATGIAGLDLQRPSCPTQTWTWNGQTLRLPNAPIMELAQRGGVLKGSDYGEFGGGLTWRPRFFGGTVLVRDENVRGLLPATEGVVAAFGLSHLSTDDGAVAWVRRRDGQWRADDIAALPGAPDALGSIGDGGAYVVWSHGHAIVFTTEGVQGTASCLRTD